jgi:hypothetical protein
MCRQDFFETCGTYAVIPDADAAYQRAQVTDATIVRPIEDARYGGREFGLKG